MEQFYINIGKVMAKNEAAMKSIAKMCTTNSKGLALLSICVAGLCFLDIKQDAEITRLRKRVNDLESKDRARKDDDDFDILK